MNSKISSLKPAVLVLAAWATMSVLLGQAGIFATPNGEPPIALLLAVVLPPTLFALAYAGSERVRSYVFGLDLRLLTAIQGWRIIGGMFLVLMGLGLLPGVFAWPAGVGDVIVGVYAPFVVYVLARRSANWRAHVVLLSTLGLLDFLGAVGGGLLAGNSALGLLRGGVTSELMLDLPLSLIPTFGVPAWIIVHLISLLKVRNNEVSELEF